jgi:cytochrome c biogenesis protein CcmG/thiol:disulfide interchange protein DsbE
VAAERASPLRYAARAAAILVAAGFVALLAYGLLTKSPDRSIDDALAEAKSAPAPAFDLPVLERGDAAGDPRLARATADGRLSLRELRGRPVVLNFWASWCVPCREEAPHLQRLWQRQRARGAVVVGLDMQDLSEDARSFIREFGLTYPTMRDRGDEVARDYGTTGLPETYFISPAGRVVGHVIGVVSPAQLSAGLAAARAGRPAAAAEGGARRKTRDERRDES